MILSLLVAFHFNGTILYRYIAFVAERTGIINWMGNYHKRINMASRLFPKSICDHGWRSSGNRSIRSPPLIRQNGIEIDSTNRIYATEWHSEPLSTCMCLLMSLISFREMQRKEVIIL